MRLNPTTPIPIGDVNIGSFGGNFIEVVGNLAFVARNSQGGVRPLTIVDISDPTHPVVIGNVPTAPFNSDVAVNADLAFVASSRGLLVIDVQDPANPILLGNIDTGIGVRNLETVGNLLFVTGHGGMKVIDISDWANPIELGFLGTKGEGIATRIVGNDIYVADGSWGLAIIEILLDEIIPSEAIEELILVIDESSLDNRRKHPLQVSLLAALASAERDQVDAAVNQLKAFQNKVRAQVTRIDPLLAEDMIGAAQEIIDALTPSGSG